MQYILDEAEMEELRSRETADQTAKRVEALEWARQSLLKRHGFICIHESSRVHSVCDQCPISPFTGMPGGATREVSEIVCTLPRRYSK